MNPTTKEWLTILVPLVTLILGVVLKAVFDRWLRGPDIEATLRAEMRNVMKDLDEARKLKNAAEIEQARGQITGLQFQARMEQAVDTLEHARDFLQRLLKAKTLINAGEREEARRIIHKVEQERVAYEKLRAIVNPVAPPATAVKGGGE